MHCCQHRQKPVKNRFNYGIKYKTTLTVLHTESVCVCENACSLLVCIWESKNVSFCVTECEWDMKSHLESCSCCASNSREHEVTGPTQFCTTTVSQKKRKKHRIYSIVGVSRAISSSPRSLLGNKWGSVCMSERQLSQINASMLNIYRGSW